MRVERVVETCLYVPDVEAAAAWYERVLGFERVSAAPPRHVFLKAGDSMFLLFDPEETRASDTRSAHGATGVQHVAFGVEDLAPWRERLAEHDVTIVDEASFGEGDSIYFEDAFGNMVELVTRGTWPTW